MFPAAFPCAATAVAERARRFQTCPPHIQFSNSPAFVHFATMRTQSSVPATQIAPGCLQNDAPRQTEGAGNAGCAMHPQPCVRKVKAHKSSHHRFTETFRHSLHDGFTAYTALFPVIGLYCHRRLAIFARLDAGVEASEPRGFAVRKACFRQPPASRPSQPALNVRDDRETPLV
jgi:hypothetical protein